jgi:hypothetical protein
VIELAVTLHRYYLPNENGAGWAEIVIGSNGFFAAVSDYGNYAFAWRHHGESDARKFFLRAERDWDYFARKLGGEHYRVYDGVETRQAIRKRIVAERRHGDLASEEARAEWEDAGTDIEDSELAFGEWLTRTCLCDAWELSAYRVDPPLEAFCKRTLPRLAAAIRAELEKETA